VDTGSRDGSREALAAGLPPGSPVLEARGAGFGAAVRVAVEHVSGSVAPGPVADDAGETRRWFWLLHDDSAPAPDALGRLLEAVEKAPSVTIAGCKELDAEAPHRLLDAGLTMTRRGRRFNPVGSDEVDQGQRDHVSDVLGVNTAGLLIRADVFEQLGGFDPALPGVGDDVDLGRRAWLAGHRVVLVPEAIMHHRSDAVEAVSGPRAVERAAAYSRLKFAPAAVVPFLVVWMLFSGLFRAVGRVMAKDPQGAAIDLAAGATGLVRAAPLAAGRRSLRRSTHVPRAVVRPLLASPSKVRERARALREEWRVVTDAEAPSQPAREASGGDESFDAVDVGPRPAGTTGAALAAVVIAAGLSALGLYRFLGAQAAAGGSLLAPGRQLGELWHAATSGWRELGTGSAAAPDPFALLIWLSGVVSFGHPQQAAVAAYVLAMPLAALAAWFAVGAVTRSAGFRFLSALAWAFAPTLQVALAQGRPGPAVVHVVLPVFVLALVRAVGAARGEPIDGAAVPGRAGMPSWAATGSAALLGVVLGAAEPLLLVPILLGCLVAAVATRRGRGLWWVPVPALVTALPLLIASVRDPRVLLAQPGLPQAADPAPWWQLLLGWPLGFDAGGAVPFLDAPGAGPWALVLACLVAVPLGLLAVAAVVRPGPGTTTARVLVLCGALTLALGAAAARLDASLAGETPVHPFVGSFVSALGLAVLLAAAVQREALLLAPGARSGRRVAAGVVNGVASTLVVFSVLASAALWVVPRLDTSRPAQAFPVGQLVEPSDGDVLPATAADRGLGAYGERTLVLDVAKDGTLDAQLATGDGVRAEDLSSVVAASRLAGNVFVPGGSQRADESAGDAAVRSVVASLASGEHIDPRPELLRLAVSHVVVRSGDTGADVLAGTLDSVPGLSAIGRSQDAAAWIWRVRPADGDDGVEAQAGSPTARVRVVGADGRTERLVPSEHGNVSRYELPSGPAGRLLLLSASADAGWSATVNGQDLAATAQGWAQAFRVPESGGVLEVRYKQGWVPFWLTGLFLVLLVSLLWVVPVPRSWRADARTAVLYRPGVGERRPVPRPTPPGESESADAAEAVRPERTEAADAAEKPKPVTEEEQA